MNQSHSRIHDKYEILIFNPYILLAVVAPDQRKRNFEKKETLQRYRDIDQRYRDIDQRYQIIPRFTQTRARSSLVFNKFLLEKRVYFT